MTQQDTEEQEVTTVSAPTSQQVVRRIKVVKPAVVTESPQKTYETKRVIFRSYQVIWYILGVVEVLLAFRLILKLLEANPFNGFTNFIYTISDIFALPFTGILRVTASSDLVLEWSTLIAMAVYIILIYPKNFLQSSFLVLYREAYSL